jgi:hypothetical protein
MQALANIEEVRILSNKLGSNSSQPGQFFLADRIDEGQFRQIHDKSRWNHAMCDEASCILFASLATKQPCIPHAIALVTYGTDTKFRDPRLLSFFPSPCLCLGIVQACEIAVRISTIERANQSKKTMRKVHVSLVFPKA